MGIPYSKQITQAFTQVTPLVSAGFEVLQTTKNISILLAAIQILTVLILFLILLTLLALLVSVNPDLEEERRALVTPVVRWGVRWGRVWVGLAVVLGGAVGVGWWLVCVRGELMEVAAEEAVGAEEEEGEGEGKG